MPAETQTLVKLQVVYKINIQKSIAVLYTNNKISEKEMKETIPFTITSDRIMVNTKIRLIIFFAAAR